jgi:hypothetical protein
MKYELRYLSFFEILGQTFILYFDNFFPLIVISFISNCPAFLFARLVEILEVSAPSISQVLSVMLFFVQIGIYVLCTALMIEFISKKYLKQHQSIGQYIRNVIPFILPVIALSIFSLIAVGLPTIVFYLVLGPNPGWLLQIAFLIPLMYLVIAIMFSPQVLIVERKRLIKSIKRSFLLTKHSKLEIFGFLIIVFFLLKKLVIGKLLVEGFIFNLIRGIEATMDTKILVAQGVNYLVGILFNPITACLFILVYFNLRIEQEGFDLEHLVDQFSASTGA